MQRFTILFLVGVVSALLTQSAEAQSHKAWSANRVMYELNVRQYSEEGTFQAIIDDLDRIESLGVGIIWFMPIHPIGQQNRLGSLGSYYSVKDFKEVNPNFGTKDDFKALVDSLHARDIYVLMDWVANHTAWDNPLSASHPEWYLTQNGQFTPPPGTNWSDVIQLDHSKKGIRDFMVEAMQYWVNEFGVDGFRFDAVSFVPDAFWLDVLPRVREARSDLFMLAEGNEEKYTEDLGFDASFSWEFYGFNGGILTDIANGRARVPELATLLSNEISKFGLDAYRLYFTSNHDENSWTGTTQELFGPYAESFAVLSWVMPGMPLIYNGQEAGLNKRLAFFEKDQIPWRDHPNNNLYKSLIQLKKTNKALWPTADGLSFRRILTDRRNEIFALYRQHNGFDRVLFLLNISDEVQEFRLSGDFFLGPYWDVFKREVIPITTTSTFILQPYDYLLAENYGPTTSVEETELPRKTRLNGAYPNPFNPSTSIRYEMAEAGSVSLNVFNLNGQLIQSWNFTVKEAGSHQQYFDASHLNSGIYFVRMQTQKGLFVQKMTLIK